jgi:hypothetical protein
VFLKCWIPKPLQREDKEFHLYRQKPMSKKKINVVKSSHRKWSSAEDDFSDGEGKNEWSPLRESLSDGKFEDFGGGGDLSPLHIRGNLTRPPRGGYCVERPHRRYK